jgi:hypothetical protein
MYNCTVYDHEHIPHDWQVGGRSFTCDGKPLSLATNQAPPPRRRPLFSGASQVQDSVSGQLTQVELMILVDGEPLTRHTFSVVEQPIVIDPGQYSGRLTIQVRRLK